LTHLFELGREKESREHVRELGALDPAVPKVDRFQNRLIESTTNFRARLEVCRVAAPREPDGEREHFLPFVEISLGRG
jgi:hypothetical protein